MNIFQIIITFTLIIILALISRSREVLFKRVFYVLISLIGVYFIVFPESASRIANLVGIGRGADLIFYLFILFSWFWFTTTSVKMQRTDRKITDIVRSIAVEYPLRTNDLPAITTDHDSVNQ